MNQSEIEYFSEILQISSKICTDLESEPCAMAQGQARRNFKPGIVGRV
jgi:hypothetical protein